MTADRLATLRAEWQAAEDQRLPLSARFEIARNLMAVFDERKLTKEIELEAMIKHRILGPAYVYGKVCGYCLHQSHLVRLSSNKFCTALCIICGNHEDFVKDVILVYLTDKAQTVFDSLPAEFQAFYEKESKHAYE